MVPKFFILDVDGVMTTGSFLYDSSGKCYKVFGPDDNDAISLVREHLEVRFITGDRIDAAIQEIDLKKRKVSLSIKLLEELQNKKALEMGSDPLSGRQLPFSSLSDKLDKKEKKKKKD